MVSQMTNDDHDDKPVTRGASRVGERIARFGGRVWKWITRIAQGVEETRFKSWRRTGEGTSRIIQLRKSKYCNLAEVLESYENENTDRKIWY